MSDEQQFWGDAWDWIITRAEYLEQQKKAAARESLQTDRTAAQPTPAQSPEQAKG